MTSDVSLLSLVAHEMRAPLAVFKGHLEMLRRAYDAGLESRHASGSALEPLPRRFTARDRLFRALVAPAFLAGRLRGH